MTGFKNEICIIYNSCTSISLNKSFIISWVSKKPLLLCATGAAYNMITEADLKFKEENR